MDLEITFHPIPRRCPIPSTVVALVGGILQNGGTFVLWKDKQTITIQFPTSKDLEGLDTIGDIELEWDLEVRTRHTYGHYLEIVVCQI